ncbi:MAG: hypothetical protein RR614_12910 [Eubacterium sp.]
MDELIILGVSRYGRVIADAVICAKGHLVGFLDGAYASEENTDGLILGKLEDASRFGGQGRGFIIAERDITKREHLVKVYEGLCFSSVIHPGAMVASDAVIGEGTYIGAGAVVGTHAHIGAHVIIGDGAVIGDYAVIDDFCHIMARVNIGSGVSVGDKTFIGLSATLKDDIKIAPKTVIQTGEIVVKDMVMKMVYKRGAWIYKENG